jgi:hypothetical protein
MSGEYKASYNYIESSGESSRTPSRPGSPGGSPGELPAGQQKRSSRVRFNSTSEANDTGNKKSSVPLRDNESLPSSVVKLPKLARISPLHSRNNSTTSLLRHTTPEIEKEDPFADLANPVLKPRPGVLRNSSYTGNLPDLVEDNEKSHSALAAQARAQRITASLVNSTASRPSQDEDDDDDGDHSRKPLTGNGFLVNIPLGQLDSRRTYDGAGDSDEETDEKRREHVKSSTTAEAHNLVRQHTRKFARRLEPASVPALLPSEQCTPTEEYGEDYVARPAQFRGGVLSSLLKLYNAEQPGGFSRSGSRGQSRRGSFESEATVVSLGSSGTTTPKSKKEKWYNQKVQSQDTLAGLVAASAKLAAAASPNATGSPTSKSQIRPGMGKRSTSGRLINTISSSLSGRGPRLEDEIKITIQFVYSLFSLLLL